MSVDNTSRMLALLGELRRDRNGMAADAMCSYGGQYGVNYGVAAHTIRDRAKAEGTDHSFAEYLYRQDVRELRIAGLWIANPELIKPADFHFWAAGIINSEIAEQAALALLSKVERIDDLLAAWSQSENVLLCYAAMLAVARNAKRDDEMSLGALYNIIEAFPDNRLAGQGAVVLLSAIAERDAEAVVRFIETQPQNSTAQFVREEIEWRVTIG